MPAIRVLLLVLSAAEPPAPPGGLGVLAVAPPPGPGPQLVEVAVDLRRLVAEAHPGVLDARALRERMTGSGAASALPELERALEGARAAWVNGEYAGSLATLRAVVRDLERQPDGPEPFALWTRAMLRLARSELSLGDDAAARATVERLVRAAPEVEVERGSHGARLSALVEDARLARTHAPASALAVKTSAPGARVYVDGRDVGASPVLVALPRGPHRVSAASGGLRVGPVPVVFEEADQEVALDFTIAAALRPSAGPGLALPDPDRSRWAIAAGAHLGLEKVLAVALTEEGGTPHVVGALYDVRRGTLEREGRVRLVNGGVPPGGSTALAEFLVTGSPSALVEVPGSTPAAALAFVPPATRAASARVETAGVRRVSGSPRGWVVAATGLAAIGLTTYGVAQLRDAGRSYDDARALRSAGAAGTIPGIERYNATVTDGDSASRRGTVALAAAGTALVVTGVVGWIHYGKTGEVGPIRF